MVKNLPASVGDMGSVPDQEDPTCRRAAKPVCCGYRACVLEPMLGNKKSHSSEKPAHDS